jgi:catechol 2,3-dioxygenase-like lactoylglutathione lyase family enzyme
MSNEWFARPVLLVADIDRSVDFYVKQLGFTQAWRYEEEGKAWVAQVDRQGCALILSSQWPDKVGKGLMFISLDVGVLDALRAELEGRGVHVKDGQWGYRLMVIADPDGNELSSPTQRRLPPAPSSRRTPGIELKGGVLSGSATIQAKTISRYWRVSHYLSLSFLV